MKQVILLNEDMDKIDLENMRELAYVINLATATALGSKKAGDKLDKYLGINNEIIEEL